MPTKIKVSLIIPTRERAETLQYTIMSSLNQQSMEYEVIVSDNFSNDKTKLIVDGFSDSRIKYINPGRRLSMTDHWNFAVPHARGDYVIIIGDDDALMPNAIDKFIGYIEQYPSKIYSWPTHVYFWPFGDKSAEIHNFVSSYTPVKIDLNKLLVYSIRFGLCNYNKLPHLYHSAVHRTILDEIFEKTGSYFKTTIPDVYMSYTLPVFYKSAFDLGESISVVGHSPKSNSGSLMSDKETEVLNKFLDEYDGYSLNKNVPIGLSKVATFILDTIFVARDLFPNQYAKLKSNNSAMMAFLYITLKTDSIRSLFTKKARTNSNFQYNFIYFLMYVILFKIYNQLRKILFGTGKKVDSRLPPPNINDFVLSVSNRDFD
jgi:glycosyltransferase involved in cell wall biosynthesis